MSILNYIAERKIQEAINNGEFDNLEGFGKPVDNTEYFSVPEEERIAFHILRNSGVVPEEIQLRKNIYQLTMEIRNSVDPGEISDLERKRQILEDRLFLMSEKRTKWK